ncbi:MAG: Phospholipase D/competence protein ComEA helix-hairpin-helix domain protein [Parcubacteria group bacterium GW2011_GWB1_42_6]|nr:MAG: Phospholipase D/competence protein ComEA helix-hairpin-helix domain protein [Parcubacteria group bacterium GW2011_GWB1_42_6]
MLTFIRYYVKLVNETIKNCNFFLLIGSVFIFFLFPQISLASPLIIINEIAWMGTETSANDEWLELYNNTDESIDLSGWKIIWADKQIDLSGQIAARSFFLLERTDDNSVPSVVADQIYIGSLNNNGEYLKLFNSQDNLIDEINAQAGWPAGDNAQKLTMERKSGGIWQNSQISGGTPRLLNSALNQIPFSPTPVPSFTSTPNPSPSPTPESWTTPSPSAPASSGDQENYSPAPIYDYSQDVYLNEFYPYPGAEEKEWIEIFNQGERVVDLTGWKIDDAENSNQPQEIPQNTKINQGDFLVIIFEKSVFNNDADQVRLIWPDGQVIHSISYPKAIKNSSCGRFGAQWLWTNQPTPGKANKKSIAVLNEKVSSPSPSIAPAPKAQTLIQEAAPPQKISPAKETVDLAAEMEIKSELAENISSNPSDYLAAESVAFDPKQKKLNDWWLILGLAALGGIFGLGFVWFRKQSSPPHND